MSSFSSLNLPSIRSTVTNPDGSQTAYYYGFELTLSQADVPWDQSAPASGAHFVVCADAVTVNSPLVNPGMDIRIFARQILLLPGAVIDTSGPPPAVTFTPGALPDQTDAANGATGASGAPASNGSPAGDVVLIAESLIGAAGAAQGAINIGPLVPSGLSAAGFTLPLNWTGNGGYSLEGTLSFSQVQVAGWLGGALRASGVSVMANGSGQTAEIAFALAGTSVSAQVSFSGTLTMFGKQQPYSDTLTMSADGVTATVTAMLATPGSDSPQVTVTLTDFQPAYTDSASPSLLADFLPSVASAVEQQIGSSLQTALGSVLGGPIPDAVLVATGGVGGRGQDGHPGVQGAQGAPGANTNVVVIAPEPAPPAASGGTGQPGGQGGNPGASGSGGPGGSIQISVVDFAPAVLSVQDAGGNGGPAPAAGAGGPGGLGGPPGSYYVSGGGPSVKTPGEPGHQGPQGPPAALQGAPGLAGPTGADTLNGTAVAVGATYPPASYTAIAPYFPTEQLVLTQQAAGLAFLGAQTQQVYQDVLSLLLWLRNITGPFLSSSFSPPGWQPADIQLAQQINAFAAAQISNFQSGFDFYGHPFDWVPILTLSEYQTNISEWLAIGEDIEDQYTIYTAEQQTAAAQLAAVQSAVHQLQSTIQSLQQQIAGIGLQIQDADTAIAAMRTQLQQQQSAINADTQTFTAAFQSYTKKQTGCSFTEVVTAVSSIVQIGAGLVDGIGVLTGAFTAENAAQGAMGAIKNGIAVIEKVALGMDDIQKGLNAIEGFIPKPNPDNVTAMLAADQQDFDNFISQYLNDFQAAQTLKDAVDDYFSMVNALNQAILSYNGLYVTQAGLQAQLNQFDQQLAQVGPVLAQSQPDPSLAVCASFMGSAYSAIKSILIQQLYEENRAYYFWSLESQPFSTTGLTIASLAQTHAVLMQQIESAQQQSAAPYQPFTQAVTISAADLPLAFSRLKTSQTLSFSISPSDPAFDNMYQVIASSYQLEFPDIKVASGVLFVELLHPGTSVQVSVSNSTIQFTHAQRSVPYKIDYGNPANTGGGVLGAADQGFVGLSPFTLWTLNFSESGNSWLDLSTIQSLVITFTGTFVGPPSERSPA
ncbi:MAG: collagen-like triple helix repeat-containing protein [Gammaproteobacteria bacterium]